MGLFGSQWCTRKWRGKSLVEGHAAGREGWGWGHFHTSTLHQGALCSPSDTEADSSEAGALSLQDSSFPAKAGAACTPPLFWVYPLPSPGGSKVGTWPNPGQIFTPGIGSEAQAVSERVAANAPCWERAPVLHPGGPRGQRRAVCREKGRGTERGAGQSGAGSPCSHLSGTRLALALGSRRKLQIPQNTAPLFS